MTTVRLTSGSDTYTTKDGDEFVLCLGGNAHCLTHFVTR